MLTVPNMARFETLKATSMKMAVFWDAAPCSLVDAGRHFVRSYCLHYDGGSFVPLLFASVGDLFLTFLF
jgi:hypothetical protein